MGERFHFPHSQIHSEISNRIPILIEQKHTGITNTKHVYILNFRINIQKHLGEYYTAKTVGAPIQAKGQC